jgi:hypothetical protein
MSYHTTINGNQRELKSQNPFYWIGGTSHVPTEATDVLPLPSRHLGL